MSLDIVALTKPIAGTSAVGGDLRDDGGPRSIYVQMKDARAQARTVERATEASGEATVLPPAWQSVKALATETLRDRSKDLEVAAWLVEALVRLEGFAGLSDGFALIDGLVERFWPELHSNDEDDVPGRLSPLAGLNGIGSEGALIQPIRMVSLLPDGPYGTHAHWHLMRMQREPAGPIARDFNEARAQSDPRELRERAAQAAKARDAFAALTARLDAACGADAPPSSHIRRALDDVCEAYRTVLGIDAGGPVAEAEARTPLPGEAPLPAPPAAVMPPASGPKPIANRDDAFVELLRIADFFRRQEPHSPLAHAIEALVARGRMPFAALMEELLPDATHRRQLLLMAGIQTDGEGRIR